jgi:hypothetical protein
VGKYPILLTRGEEPVGKYPILLTRGEKSEKSFTLVINSPGIDKKMEVGGGGAEA